VLKRTISGIVLIAIVVAAILSGPLVFGLLLLVFSLIASNELSKAFKIHSDDKKINSLEVLMYASVLGIYIASFLSDIESVDRNVLLVLVATILIALAIYVFGFPKYQASDIAKAIFSIIYAPLLLSFGYRIEAFSKHPYVTVGLIFIVSSICDMMAYFVGSAIGKHKLAPELSPKKTIEGALGGIISVVICCIVYGLLLKRYSVLSHNYVLSLTLIGLFGSIISQIGDLAASAIKRNYGIKDYGKLIPGHGGVMDRVDSWIVVMPIIYFGLVYLNPFI